MLRPETIERVYLHRAPVDMRRQRNGLAALAQEVIKVDPFCGALFCFIGSDASGSNVSGGIATALCFGTR